MALGAIYTALKALIAADGTTAALIANAPVAFGGGKAIYDEGGAPQVGRVFPDLTIGAGTMTRFNSFQTAGWNCTVQIKATNQGTEASGQAILTALAALLYLGRPLTVSGYSSAWCDEFFVQPTIVTTQAGIVTREWPVILRVLAT